MMAAPTSTYSVQIGPQARVMLGTGATSVLGSQAPQSGQLARQVVVTPLTMASTQPQIPRTTISKVLIKAVKGDSSGKKADGKTFTLRNIDPSKVKTCSQLKTLIRAQLQEDIRTRGDFDVGYIQSNSVVTLRSSEDMQEIWNTLSKGTKVTLWCDGLRGSSSNKNSRKRKQHKSDDSEDGDSGAEFSSKFRKKKKMKRFKS